MWTIQLPQLLHSITAPPDLAAHSSCFDSTRNENEIYLDWELLLPPRRSAALTRPRRAAKQRQLAAHPNNRTLRHRSIILLFIVVYQSVHKSDEREWELKYVWCRDESCRKSGNKSDVTLVGAKNVRCEFGIFIFSCECGVALALIVDKCTIYYFTMF